MKSFKKTFLTAGCLLMAAFAACTNSGDKYVINGQVEGLEDGTVVTLVPMSHDNDSALAEATIQEGKFQLTGVASEPICARVSVKGAYGGPFVVLENKEYTLSGKVERGGDVPAGALYNWDVKVTGSPLTDKLAEFDARHDSLDILYKAFHERVDGSIQKMHSLKGKDLEAFKQTDEYKAIVDGEKEFFDTVEKTITGMINENKESFWGPLLAVKYYSYFDRGQRDLFNTFPEDVQNSFYGKKMRAELWPAEAAADKVDKFVLKGEDGKEYNFAQLAEGKKYVLLDFWASWCGPCRKEIPNVKAQYQLYKDKGFEVVSISIDKDEAAWKKAVAEEKLEWPNFLSREVADMFNVSAVPTVYLIDATGKIIADGDETRGEGLANTLAELFK